MILRIPELSFLIDHVSHNIVFTGHEQNSVVTSLKACINYLQST